MPTYNAIAQAAGKTKDGWQTSFGLTSIIGIDALNEDAALKIALSIWKERKEWPVRNRRLNSASFTLYPSVVEGY